MGATIGHIILSVSDFKKAVAFYDPLMRALGFRIGIHAVNAKEGIKSYHSGSHCLFLKWQGNRKHRPFSRDVGLDHLAFKVGGKSKVNDIHQLVVNLKATITVPPKPYPEYSKKYHAFYFRDPDGIPLEIASY